MPFRIPHFASPHFLLCAHTCDNALYHTLNLTPPPSRGRVKEDFFHCEVRMTLQITRPVIEARIQRYLQSGQFQDLDELLAKALDALPEPEATATPPERGTGTGQDLIDASAKVRGLLTDEEVDTLFSRTPSFIRPVDFE